MTPDMKPESRPDMEQSRQQNQQQNQQEDQKHAAGHGSGGQHWASLNEVSFVAGMKLLFWICRIFGRWPFRLVLYPVLLWYVLAKAAPRRASLAYLTRISNFVNVRANMRGVLLHFAAFAEVILDKMLLWGGLYPLGRVQFHGLEPIQRHLEEKRGLVLVCSHLGNLELCRILSRQRQNLKLTVLVHTKHAKAFNQMLAAISPESQLNLLQVTEMNPATAMLLAERVARGEFIVIAGDRIPVSPNPRVVMAPFLGAPAAFPIGPYVLAGVLNCPLYMLFSQNQDGQPTVWFELLRETIQLPRKRHKARRATESATESATHSASHSAAVNDMPEPDQQTVLLTQLAGEYAARLEYYCLRSPLQWFNFYDFWHLPRMESSDASR